MNVTKGLRNPLLAGVVSVVAGLAGFADEPANPTLDSTPSQLRWTPHRIAATPRDEAPVQKPAAAPAQPSAPAGAAAPTNPPPAATPAAPSTATVTLPGTIPPADTPQFAPLRQGFPQRFGEWVSTNRLAGALRTSTSPAPNGVFGIDVTRAPQGDRGRPILAVEGTGDRQRGGAAAYGGDAPRFNPVVTPPRPASERIAMNVDGMPSVMARGPQAFALDDKAAPARLPAAAQPPAAETIPDPLPRPAPTSAAPTATLDMGNGGVGDGLGMPIDGPLDLGPSGGSDDAAMWMGHYPAQVHVESFYDDPYACEEGDECGCLPIWQHDGRICAWLRQFGRPYYGWRWYRDFTASAGVTSFTNPTDLGIHGNYGVNEYLNWSMPFWNAFGVGWQVGVRGVQTSFQPATVTFGTTTLQKGSRDQVFVTTGFFTRAFEGRGLQGGAVYDYLSDGWYTDVNVAQIRNELSYVWGYHEIGYWGAQNVSEQLSIFTPRRTTRITGTTLDLYTAFYRLHFGDANEWRIWGGASGNGDGLVGSSMRAPMSRSLALEGTFTYLIPKESQRAALDNARLITSTYGPAAWNVSVNIVYYPACRSRRSLASPYRPLFDVADNGSMIRSLVLP